MDNSLKILSDVTVFSKYAKYIPQLNRRETWEEIVFRNKEMHKSKFPKLSGEIEEAYKLVLEYKILPSMRSMQFGGKPIKKNNARIYNCSYVAIDSVDSFSEAMFLLLSGCGVGYSVQTHHIKKLPVVRKPLRKKKFLIGDSIEGWSDAVKVLMNAYLNNKYLPEFDYSDIRAKGTPLKTSGGKAPGPGPLRFCLDKIQSILENKGDGDKLTSLECHDIICFIADAILSGGIRRSATISLFDIDDDSMLECKFGNWWESNPQRGRANNSTMILRNKITKDVFKKIFKKIELSGSGEPGYLLSNNKELGTNPCGEIGLKNSGFCNLCEINVSDVVNQEDFNNRVKWAAFIGTLQASYTDFHYLRDVWKETAEKEALLGIGMTGIASNKLNGIDLKLAVQIAIKENERVAKLIGINKAKRITTTKPSGTSSCVLGTSSGIHSWHSTYYLRRITLNKEEDLYKYLIKNVPELIENSVLKPTTEAYLVLPIKSPDGAITTMDESAIEFLNRIKYYYDNWILPGHISGDNTHNISATVNVKKGEWEEVSEWAWNNRNHYTALSFFPFNDSTYVQTPFETCTKAEYDKRIVHVKSIDLTQVKEFTDNTSQVDELACSGGVCEIK